MQRSNRPFWMRYGAAIAAVGLTLVIKLLLIPIVSHDEPFVLFFAAVLVAAWIGGLGPGLLATALATIFNFYFFMEPYNNFAIANGEQAARLGLSVLEGVCISIICNKLQSARQRAEDSEHDAQELERRMLEITDAEQRRIGHDLHDGLGQHLTGIALLTKRLEQRLSVEGSHEKGEAAKVAQLANEAVSWTHDLCRSLSPPALEREGLSEALQQLAANAESIFNIRCTVSENADCDLRDVTAGVHLYRIAQEAISNAVKHGKAKNIAIHLTQGEGGQIAMTIVDDGAGIKQNGEANGAGSDSDAGGRSASNGMGLRIMRYRAKMIGATVDVEPRHGGGTSVTCHYRPPRLPHPDREAKDNGRV
ncbi:MAG TPA: sensor histidine kinase [Tepidisphaeraceae bacterium]|jgi:signal transduction histidine kinase